MKIYIGYILLILFLFSSCFEEDKRVLPYPGERTFVPYNIEDTISYYDFESDSIFFYIPTLSWDLAFECSPKGFHVLVNSGKNLFIYNTKSTNLLQEFGDIDQWNYDNSNGHLDSTAIGNWVDTNTIPYSYTHHIYLLGLSQISGIEIWQKLQFVQIKNNSYKFRYINATMTEPDTIEIIKNEMYNYTHYSFLSHKQLYAEPVKTSYDIVFTPYYDYVKEFDLWADYLLRGVFLNPSKVEAAEDTLTGYTYISLDNFSDFILSSQKDLIGYDWKKVNVDFNSISATYSIVRNKCFIIHTVEGNYYKMRFLSYQKNGLNGYPSFEFKEL